MNIDKIRTDCFQIFIMDTPIPLPLSLFRHSYIVVNDHGTFTRWEVMYRFLPCAKRVGYVHRNYANPWDGLGFFLVPLFTWDPSYPVRCLHMEEGDSHSEAALMADFLTKNAFLYDHKDRYIPFPGPNSNTFVAWFLDHFPHVAVSLSPFAPGRNYGRYAIRR